MGSARYLVVNADDFGQSPAINRGIIQAHEKGIVSSASLMVRWPAAAAAAAYARQAHGLSLGLHFDFGEWICREGAWEPVYEVVPLEDRAAVRAEAARQLEIFRELAGQDPSHLDSHQHVHRREPVRAVLLDLAGELRLPLRHLTPRIRYCGDFYGQAEDGSSLPQAIEVDALCRILDALPPGWTELACHPGYADGLQTMYQAERECELQTLCNPRVREAIARVGIELRSLGELP